MRYMRLVTAMLVFVSTAASAQCPNEPCTPNYQVASSWSTGVSGGNPNGTNQDCHILSSSGQFPGAIQANIAFSKEPQPGNGCKFQTGGASGSENNPWHRWAQIDLPSCVDLGIKVDYQLGTFDHWVPGSPSNSDVFYLGVGSSAFTSVGSLGAVSCANAPQFSSSLFPGKVYWWGNNVVRCDAGTACNNFQSSNQSPCVMNGTRFFDFRQNTSTPALRVGLNTGYCIWSYGSFNLKILPLIIDVLDPVSQFVSNGEVVNDPQGLSTYDRAVQGVAADGATQVVLRHEVLGLGQVEFQLNDPDGGPTSTDEIGFLSSLGGQEEVTALTVNVEDVGGRYFAFVVYHAPADFVTVGTHVNFGCRRVSVQAEFHPAEGDNIDGTTKTTRNIKIIRPAVVLLHGLWSSASTWGPVGAQTFLTDPNFLVEVGDYAGSADAAYLANKAVVRGAIAVANGKLRKPPPGEQLGFAVTRADVVGHSMGGVLARLYAQNFGGVTYKRNANFNKGDIHKLICVDSPHKGSPLATVLVNPAFLNPRFKRAFEQLGYGVGGAVANLDPSAPLPNPISTSNSQPTDLYAHAVVGIGGATVLANPSSTTLSSERNLARAMNFLGMNVFIGPHDMIVDQPSQVGNINNTTVFNFLNATNPATHGSIHKETRVKNRVRDLLNTNILVQGAFTPTIPARGPGGVLPAPPVGNDVEGMSMIFPTNGAVFSSGGTLPIIVAPINKFEPTSILVFSVIDVQEIDPKDLTAVLTIPDYYAGPLTLYAAAFDANGDYAETATVSVQIVPSATLTGISVAPTAIELGQFSASMTLTVTGHYDDNIDRDLTLGVLGTTYQSSDENVAIVSVNGVVTSVGFGACTITATNSNFNDVAQVEVTGLPCPADVIEDGAVNVSDMLAVINSWGPCFACAADIDGDGNVGVSDLLAVINAWGPCPAPQQLMAMGGGAPDPNYDCIDVIKWGAYLDVLINGTPEEVTCWNCWVYWRLCVCAGQCPSTPPDCACPDPL